MHIGVVLGIFGGFPLSAVYSCRVHHLLSRLDLVSKAEEELTQVRVHPKHENCVELRWT